jgi:hypothetical protein
VLLGGLAVVRLVSIEIYYRGADRSTKSDMFKFDIIKSDFNQVLIAEFLKRIGKSKPTILKALYGFYASQARSEHPNSSQQEVELALLESLNTLSAQMRFLVNYHRVKDGINLSPECLMSFGLLPMSQPLTNPQVHFVDSASVDSPQGTLRERDDDEEVWIQPPSSFDFSVLGMNK